MVKKKRKKSTSCITVLVVIAVTVLVVIVNSNESYGSFDSICSSSSNYIHCFNGSNDRRYSNYNINLRSYV